MVRDLLIEDDPQNVAMLESFVRSGYRLDGYESVERTPDGGRRVFLNSLVGLVRDGAMVEAWGAQRDITERKHRESQARQAQAMDAVTLLSGSVAHDFNNLLTTILSSVELLAEQCTSDERASADVEAIRRSARRGAELTRQLLALSRQQVLSPRPVDVHALVRRVAESIRSVFARSARVEFSYDDGPGVASVDVDELEQTLLHLAAHAAEVIGDRRLVPDGRAPRTPRGAARGAPRPRRARRLRHHRTAPLRGAASLARRCVAARAVRRRRDSFVRHGARAGHDVRLRAPERRRGRHRAGTGRRLAPHLLPRRHRRATPRPRWSRRPRAGRRAARARCSWSKTTRRCASS